MHMNACSHAYAHTHARITVRGHRGCVSVSDGMASLLVTAIHSSKRGQQKPGGVGGDLSAPMSVIYTELLLRKEARQTFRVEEDDHSMRHQTDLRLSLCTMKYNKSNLEIQPPPPGPLLSCLSADMKL